MKAKEFLSRPRDLWKQLNAAKQKVASLKALTERVSIAFGPDTEPVSHSLNTSAMQDAAIRLSEARDELVRLHQAYFDVVLEVGLVLAGVTDPMLHEFLEKRFLEFMPVEKAATSMGFSPSWGRFIQPKALAAVQQILDDQPPADLSPATILSADLSPN